MVSSGHHQLHHLKDPFHCCCVVFLSFWHPHYVGVQQDPPLVPHPNVGQMLTMETMASQYNGLYSFEQRVLSNSENLHGCQKDFHLLLLFKMMTEQLMRTPVYFHSCNPHSCVEHIPSPIYLHPYPKCIPCLLARPLAPTLTKVILWSMRHLQAMTSALQNWLTVVMVSISTNSVSQVVDTVCLASKWF